MKKFWKMIASAAIAASMVSMTAVSVGAVDYGQTPSYQEPEKVPDKPETTPETPVSVVTDDTVKEALKADEPVIYIEPEKASVKEDAIGEIAKSDKPVTFEAEEYAITIDPALITEVKAINLAMDISAGAENSSLAEDSGIEMPENAITLIPAQKGEFGMTLVVTIPADVLGDLDADKAALYYVADDGSVTKMSAEALTFDEDGCAIIRISHASEYVISTVDISKPANNNTPGESNGNTTNPDTGAVIPMGIAAIAGASAVVAIIAAKKRK